MTFLRHRFDGLGGRHLLVRFGLLSAVVVVGLGLVLAQRLREMVQDAELHNISAATSFTVNFGLRGYLANGSGSLFSKETVAQLGQTIHDLRLRDAAEGLRFVSPVYRFTVGIVPSYPDASGDRSRAMSGRNEARRVGASYVITVPVVLPRQTRPFGSMAVAVPAREIDDTVAADARNLYLILIGGLAALWLVLLPIVARAARLLRRQAEQNELLARSDALTGLPNRTWFGEQLQALAARGAVGAMVIDADRFKRVNDTHGHHVGDLVLQSLGTRIRSAVRVGDVVGRLGGDEFAVALDTDEKQTLAAVAARIVELARAPIEADGTIVTVQVSVGVAVTDEAGDVERLLREADDAMYRAKSAGGGRAELDLVHAA
jgi:diguanylate cyclase (GGDEF)-like protein